MTDQTRKLFDAPWRTATHPFDYAVSTAHGDMIASDSDEKVSARLARLPELYDALMEAKNEIYIMLNEWAIGKSEVEYLEAYQKRKGKKNYEFFNEVQTLLENVRDRK